MVYILQFWPGKLRFPHDFQLALRGGLADQRRMRSGAGPVHCTAGVSWGDWGSGKDIKLLTG